ncbi:heavy-metal-associated domain-containing protein [Euzebya sp.]|uniref:heavy-metal-associated domain-containing protein n=1 Tax=Euzebya sp. TaxID=1971409 RepID=UPI0035148E48
MAHRTVYVENIHCEGCSTSIRRALATLDGVEDVQPDTEHNTVGVTFIESLVDEDTIAQRLADRRVPGAATTFCGPDRSISG